MERGSLPKQPEMRFESKAFDCVRYSNRNGLKSSFCASTLVVPLERLVAITQVQTSVDTPVTDQFIMMFEGNKIQSKLEMQPNPLPDEFASRVCQSKSGETCIARLLQPVRLKITVRANSGFNCRPSRSSRRFSKSELKTSVTGDRKFRIWSPDYRAKRARTKFKCNRTLFSRYVSREWERPCKLA